MRVTEVGELSQVGASSSSFYLYDEYCAARKPMAEEGIQCESPWRVGYCVRFDVAGWTLWASEVLLRRFCAYCVVFLPFVVFLSSFRLSLQLPLLFPSMPS